MKEQSRIAPTLYSDGVRSEREMLSAVRGVEDVTLDSEELSGKTRDLPSYFHLGIGRSVVLHCLDLPADSKVLELGAGCGAITRYLGERFARVEAIEQNPLRAEIARERCRDLENVVIACMDLKEHGFSPTYDIVVIIGVLEYAPVHIYPQEEPRNAALRFLRLARSALTETGRLVLAIENRLGLDYWAGAPEPHTGRAYDGIHQYPNAGSQITFSRVELQELLREAGFAETSFYFCFPDYHFARTILSSSGGEREYFLHNWVDFTHESPSNQGRPAFNKHLAAKNLSESEILREFANAFLVVGGAQELATPSWAAKIYNMRRRREFRTVTTLRLRPQVSVHKERLSSPGDDSLCEGEGLGVNVPDVEWRPGDSLIFEVERGAVGHDFYETVRPLMARYHEELVKSFQTGEEDEEGFPLLKAEAFDALFGNIIQGEGDTWHFIDEEVLSRDSVPIDLVLYRCIRFCLYRHGVGDREAKRIIGSLYPDYTRSRHRRNRALADASQREMVLEPINPKLLRRNLLMRIATSRLCRPYVEKVWFGLPHGVRTFVRRRV